MKLSCSHGRRRFAAFLVLCLLLLPTGFVCAAIQALDRHLLLTPQPHPDGRYLIETAPRFADYRQWISSDYLLQRLGLAGELTASGTVAGRQLVTLDAERLQNLRGHIQGADVEVRAQTDLLSRGGTFTARDRLAVSAGRDLSLESSTVDQHYRQAGRVAGAVDKTVVDRVAGLYVTGDQGALTVSAGNDLKLQGAAIASAGSAILAAGHDLTLGTVSESSQAATTAKKGYWRENRSTEIGSTLQTSGDLTLVAGNDLTARAANVSSDQGALLASAGNDLKIDAGQARTATETYRKSKKGGLLGSRSTVRRDTVEDSTALASTFSGDSTTLIADRDLSVRGSNVVATKDTTLSAGRDLTLEAATQTHNETHFTKTRQSGVFSSGGIGFTIGSRQNSTDQKTDATLAAQSTVGSTAGNVLLLAGEKYRQVGSDVIAVQGDINVAAKRVDIVEARQTSRTVTETKSKQSGLTLAVSSPVISAIQTVQQMSQAAAQTKDPRMQWLAAANIAMTGKNTVDAVVAGQGTTVELPNGTVKDNQMPVLDESGKTIGSRDPNAADQVGGINVSLSLGSSQSRSKSTQTSDTAAASNLTAGRDISITASDAGEQSDLTIQGSKATAARNLTLTADDEIKLLAARNTAEQHSTNKNRSASVGIGFALGGTQNGFTIQAGVSGGKGQANGTDLAWSNTHVEAGNLLAFESGGNTTLRGAVARGEQVIARIGKDLTIESLQDLSTYDSKQKSLGASVSLCILPFCVGATPVSGSVSASASKVNSNYASVTEQSALRAGGGGFDVKVKNDTDLKGGAITSTQQAIDDNKNAFHTDGTLTLSDIDNKASYSAKSASINVGTGFSAAGALVPQGTSMGFGKDSGSASGTTRAAISGIAGNTNARTGDKETGVAKIFDAAKVQKEIEAQTRITQMFGQLASKAVGDFAVSRSNVLKDQARQEGDSDKRAALYAEARLWDEGGAYRVALHTVIGGLGGGTPGALGAGASAAAAPLLNELQENIAKNLKEAGASDNVAKLAGQLISGTTATGIGALASGGSTAGAAMGLNVDVNNRQLHPDQIKLIQKMSSDPEKQKQLTVVLCVLQNCDINGLSGYDSSGQALYKTGEQLRSMSPEQFKQLAVEIGNAGLLSGQFAYPLGGLDFTKDAVGKGINDKLNAIEKAYDVAISKPEDLGSAATGAIKGLANNVKDAPQYPLDNDDEKRGAIWANIALVAGPTAVAGVEGGLNALGSAVERRLAPSTVSLETNTAAYTGVIEIVGPYIKLGSKDSFVSSRVYKQAFNSQESLVIGSLVDTEVGSQLGMRRLNEQDWTINVNDAWMQGGIDGGKTFYLGSNISIGNLRTGNSLYPKSIFFRELLQLRDANYFRQGELMMPPKKQ